MARRHILIAAIGSVLIAGSFAFQLWLATVEPSRPGPLDLPKPFSPAVLGDSVPLIELRDLEGSSYTLGASTDGPTFIYFWASWCSPCLVALPQFEASLSRFEASGIKFISVAQDEASAAKQVLAKIPISFPVLVSEGASADPVVTYGSRDGFVPYSVLLDENGTVLLQVFGEVDVAKVIAAVPSRADVAL